MKDFIKFAYHSNDDKALVGMGMGVLGVIGMVAVLGILFFRLSPLDVGESMLLLLGLASVWLLLGAYLLIADARKAQIGDDSKDEAA